MDEPADRLRPVPRATPVSAMHPYLPRPIRHHGLRRHAGWRLKVYSIAFGAAPLDWIAFEPGLDLALAALPTPAATGERPGVGFLIAHRGRNADYLVLGWWDRENELPVRVFLRTPDEPGWRPARGSESFCVWDLQVIGFEREAYVSTVLSDSGADGVAAYLERHLGVDPEPAQP
ncbi:MAG TPA: hypothetical protein VHG28_12625 [Longimicrobiaceae bacterium]|nr:hypothetical protein [Longimicrobiaceae bacterium]